MNKMSNREKVLIYILICLVTITFGISLLVIPAYNFHSAKQDNYKLALEEKKQFDLEIKLLDARKKNILNMEKSDTENKKNFFEEIPNYEIDSIITNMATKRNVDIISLAIIPPKEEDVQEQTTTDIAENIQSGDTTQTQENVKEESKSNVPTIKTTSIIIEVAGKTSDLVALADDFAKKPQMRVTAMNITLSTGSFTVETYIISDK